MKCEIDDTWLVITVTKQEQRALKANQRRDDFDSDQFMTDLFEPLVTNDEYNWLPEGCTGDLTSAPMLAVLGDEMPGPDDIDDTIGMGLVHVGRWTFAGRLRQMYCPVLKRWAFMSYQITTPQRELAESGKCVWEGGTYWEGQVDAEKATALH